MQDYTANTDCRVFPLDLYYVSIVLLTRFLNLFGLAILFILMIDLGLRDPRRLWGNQLTGLERIAKRVDLSLGSDFRTRRKELCPFLN